MAEKPSILVTRRLPDAVLERIARDYEGILNEQDVQYSASDILELSSRADAILPCSTEKFGADLINALPARVQAIATYSAGYDHIDLGAAKARGIVVTNTPDALTDSTAEIALLCLLGAARQAHNAGTILRTGQWDRWEPTAMLGVELTGKRLGILGMGRIGRGVAKRARGFDMEIHYHNRSQLEPALEQGAVYHEQPEEMLPQVDILSINCPLSPETHHFINAERIASMRDGAILVNTARGPIVEDSALIAALRSGKIAAAGLDVFEGEPAIDPAYVDLPNAFLLPHIGSATVEARNAMGFHCLDNLDAWFSGKAPPNRLV